MRITGDYRVHRVDARCMMGVRGEGEGEGEMDDEITDAMLKCHFCMEHRVASAYFRIPDSNGRVFTMGSSAASTMLPTWAVIDGRFVCDGCSTEYRVDIDVRAGEFASVCVSRRTEGFPNGFEPR